MQISVITAVFNSVTTISCALESIRSQTHRNVQHVIVDGGSSDGSLKILAEQAKPNTILISEPDNGIYDALNKGIRRASGEIIAILHSDDFYYNNDVLSRVASVFSDDNVDALYGDLVYVRRHEPEKIVRYWRAKTFSPRSLKWGWMPPHPTLFLRRSLYDRYGLFDPSFHIAADYDLILRVLSQAQGKVIYVPDILVAMRTGGLSNRSIPMMLRKSIEDYSAIKSNRIGGMPTLIWKNCSKLAQFFQKPRIQK